MTRQLDPKGQAIDFSYDGLGRVTYRDELSGVSSLLDSSYTTHNRETNSYRSSSPGKAQLASVTYRQGSNGTVLQQKTFNYDSLGRVVQVDSNIEGTTYSQRTTYDQYGRVFQAFDATGGERGIRNVYNTWGYLSQIKEARDGVNGTVYQQVDAMDAFGNVTQMTLGNGVIASASYAATNGRLTHLQAFKGATKNNGITE